LSVCVVLHISIAAWEECSQVWGVLGEGCWQAGTFFISALTLLHVCLQVAQPAKTRPSLPQCLHLAHIHCSQAYGATVLLNLFASTVVCSDIRVCDMLHCLTLYSTDCQQGFRRAAACRRRVVDTTLGVAVTDSTAASRGGLEARRSCTA